ncbi:MAG: hypothetical protein DRG78_18170 [Epsilonproteobacteria bacterium]|nr:MAG: hypothetical protein DRG78_18170 [Campylobacterota bacterium]
MALGKFDKLKTSGDDDKTTHADLQIDKKKVGRPSGTSKVKEQANCPFTVALTKTQREELFEYAKKDDRTAGYVVKKALIEKGIITK